MQYVETERVCKRKGKGDRKGRCSSQSVHCTSGVDGKRESEVAESAESAVGMRST